MAPPQPNPASGELLGGLGRHLGDASATEMGEAGQWNVGN